MPIDPQIQGLRDNLTAVAPTSVANKPVAKWAERLEVFDDFIAHYASYEPDLCCKMVERTNFIVSSTANRLPIIKPLGPIDGAVRAAGLFSGDPTHKPIMVIAANAEHMGGSLYRVPRTGDAQEEQAGNTFAGALALATIPGVLKKVENGEMFYSDSYHQSLKRRVALVIDNVPGTKGKRCDQILVAAPDLSKAQECYSNGIFNEASYAREIYRMYCNIFEAIKDKSPSQPIVFNLPGTGVFLGRNVKVRAAALTIQGLCLRQALLDSPAMLNRQIELPFENQIVLDTMKLSVHSDSEMRRLQAVINQALSDLKQPTHAGALRPTAQPKLVTRTPSCQFYQEGANQLAIEFPSKEDRDAFLGTMGSPSAYSLVDNSNVVVLTSSSGKGTFGVYLHRGTLAVNFLNEASRDQVRDVLGLSSSALVRCSGTSIHFNHSLPLYTKASSTQEVPGTKPKDDGRTDEMNVDMRPFDELLEKLKQINNDLTKKAKHNRNYHDLSLSFNGLHTSLEQQRRALTLSSLTPDNVKTFRDACILAINEAKTQASPHRGWHRVNPIIRAFLGVLAALTVIPALIMVATSGYRDTFFQTPKTKTLQEIEGLDDAFSENTSKRS